MNLFRIFRTHAEDAGFDAGSRAGEQRDYTSTLVEVADLGKELGRITTTMSEGLEQASTRVEKEAEEYRRLLASTADLEQSNRTVDGAAGRAREAASEASEQVRDWRRDIDLAVNAVNELTESVGTIEQQVGSLKGALDRVAEVAAGITSIAKQTNLLALNATIEATRAGEVGRGFAVVAEHVKELARQTSEATGGIRELLEELTSRIDHLMQRGAEGTTRADSVREGTDLLSRLMSSVAVAMEDVERESDRIGTAVSAIDDQCRTTVDGLNGMQQDIDTADQALQDARQRARTLRDTAVALEAMNTADTGSRASAVVQAARHGRQLAVEGSDIAGAVDMVVNRVAQQVTMFEELQQQAGTLSENHQQVDEAARGAQHVAATASQDMQASAGTVHASITTMRELADEVSGIHEELTGLVEVLARVSKAAQGIDGIAKQTNLLALNAAIEAARAGDAGQGFAVVADEVKQLAQQTSDATMDIGTTLEGLSEQANALVDLGAVGRSRADEVRQATASLDQVVDRIGTAMGGVDRHSSEIVEAVQAISRLCDGMAADLSRLRNEAGVSSDQLGALQEAAARALQQAQALLNVTNDGTLETPDREMIQRAMDAAREVSETFEKALRDGRISREALFDREYQPIDGTNPQQYLSQYTGFTDEVLPPIQEPHYEAADQVLGCCTTDDHGYIATHNRHVSRPQRQDDPVWNAANCRNRRLFNDPVGLAAARNREPFLLQAYRRNMGDRFVLTMDASAPVMVNGTHWGAARVIYRP